MSLNMRWHRQASMKDRLREHVRDTALTLAIRPGALRGIYRLLKECDIVSSQRDMARQCNVSNTTISAWLREGDDINARADTIKKISDFVMPHLRKLHGSDYTVEELAATLVGPGSGLRDELVEMLEGN
jgi:hypothetical protein